MPFTNTCMGIFQEKPYKKNFHEIVCPLVETHSGLSYIDFTKFYEPQKIKMELIYRMIQDATLIIAEVSEKNENVFFEIGIAYTLKKPTIFLCSDDKFNDL